MATTMEDNFKFTLDIHFAQKLAGNFSKIRERTVKKLKRWIAARSVKQDGKGMEDELMRLWKGLFYCMWMCDKPLVQEDLADKIADLIHSFSTPEGAMAFFDAFLLTMKREWMGIDRLRMDKYFMFIRRCLRQVLVILRNNNWEDSVVDQFLAVLCKTPLSTDPEASPDGLRYHFIDIYREELARCAGKELTPSDQVMKLIEPFCILVTTTRNKTLLKVVLRGFFQEIVDESSVGFPDESEDEGIDSGGDDGGSEGKDKATEEGEERDDEPQQKAEKKKKYPRKERPKLQYDYQAIADRLFTLASKESTPGPVRRKVYAIVKKFRDLKEGVFPDYNMGSLLDYQDDDDDERNFVIRDPPAKKISRRGGKRVRERRLATANEDGQSAHEVADGVDVEGSDEEDGKPKKGGNRKMTRRQGAADASSRAAKGGEGSDEDDDGGGSDEEGRAPGKDKAQKRRRRRRRKRKLGGGEHGDVEAASSNDAANDKPKISGSEKQNSDILQEGGTSSEPDTPEYSKTIPNEKLPKNKTEKNEPSKEERSPCLDDSDGGHKAEKKTKKRKLDGLKSGAATPVNENCEATESGRGDVRNHAEGAKEQKSSTDNSGTLKSVEKSESHPSKRDKGKPRGMETCDPEPVLQLNLSAMNGELGALPPTTSSQSRGGPTPTGTNEAGGPPGDGKLQATPKGGTKKRKKSPQPFAVFQAVSTPPAALARRRPIRMKDEPQTEPLRKTKSRLSGVAVDGDCDGVTPRKRVKIALGLNETHGSKDYKKQLESSPGIPFDGARKPTQSALRTPSPRPRPPKGKRAATPAFRTQRPEATSRAGSKSATPTLTVPGPKTPSPKVTGESRVKSGLRTAKSPKTASSLRRSSRIKIPKKF